MSFDTTVHYFKPSGKWYAAGRCDTSKFEYWRGGDACRTHILHYCGKAPGLSSVGETFTWVIIPDEGHPTGYPFLVRPVRIER